MGVVACSAVSSGIRAYCLSVYFRQERKEVKGTLIHIKWYQSRKFICIFQVKEDRVAEDSVKYLFAGRQRSRRQSGGL
jgi:hypothetical protein